MEREFLVQLPFIERAIAFIARKHHLAESDAEDFASRVKIKLIENEYAVLRTFEGRSTLQTFLTTVIRREFVEYQRARLGKWHPSAEAKRGGPVLVLLEQYLVRDSYSFEDACEVLATKHGVTLTRQELETLSCRLPIRYSRRFEPIDAVTDIVSSEVSPDVHVANEEREHLRARVYALLASVRTELPDLDRLILAYRFEDGRTVAEIAIVLAVDQKGLYRRVTASLRKLRGALESRGIDASVVRDLFEGSD
jgi:RNA polymerase sigma factor (sigma-70 family)